MDLLPQGLGAWDADAVSESYRASTKIMHPPDIPVHISPIELIVITTYRKQDISVDGIKIRRRSA